MRTRPLIHLRTLGATELHVAPDAAAPVLGAGKPLAVLAYLSTAPDRTALRSELVALLWADVEPQAGRHALRQALWYLRQRTGRDLVATVGDSLRLSADVSVDRDALLAAANAGEHDRVIQLYAGPFMPAPAAPGGAGFEAWAALERRRLLDIFRRSTELVVGAQLARGHARDAIALALRLRDQDVAHQASWRLLIEACTSAGDQPAAKAEAEALRQLAERDGFELEPATRSAIRFALTLPPASEGPGGRSVPPVSAARQASLVGREAAFATLLEAWEDARKGKLVRVHIAARPGIGKTRLLRDLAARLRAMRGRVVPLAGTLGTREVPYAVASELAAGLAALPGKQGLSPEAAATLVELNPSLSTYFDAPPRRLATEDAMRARTLALRELAVAVAFEHPVAILIDDLHWWDASSAALISAFSDGLGNAKILLVTTGRPEAHRSRFASGSTTRHIALEPLTATQVEELVLSIAALPAEPWATGFGAQLWRATRGSPLLALEVLQLLEERQLLQRGSGTWRTDRPEALGDELRAGNALRARIEDMDPDDRWLLTLLASAGSPVDPDTLVEAAETTSAEVSWRIASLESRGLVVRESGRWNISHDEISDELRRVTPEDALRRATSCVGRALYATGPFSEARARRAARLLRACDDVAGRDELFRRFAGERYALGDRRMLGALATDLFGPSVRPAEVLELRDATPWTWRLGLVSRARRVTAGVGAGAVVLLAALGLIVRPDPPAPDAVLGLVSVDDAGQATFRSVELRDRDWTPQQALPSRPWDAVAPFTVLSDDSFATLWDRRHGQMFTAEAVNDDGLVELLVRRGQRAARRLASASGVDEHPALSPDGTRLAFATARWGPPDRAHIALLSLEDGSVTQVTDGDASDTRPAWAPDGNRIAFGRDHADDRPGELCVATIEPGVVCRQASGDGGVSPLGWMDDDRIAWLESTGSGKRVRVMQWSTGDAFTLTELAGGRDVSLSPDMQWAFCLCTPAGAGEAVPLVFPLATPALARTISLPPGAPLPTAAFWISSRTDIPATRVTIDRAVTRAPVAVPLQLSASVIDGRGREIGHLAALRWRVSDPAAARIDSLTGILVASGLEPEFTVYALAGAQARDSLELHAARDSAPLLLEEGWTDPGMSRWMLFGRPVPEIVLSDGMPTLLNNGDGSFSSGGLSRQAFPPVSGLAVEVRLAMPVTAPHGQSVTVGLFQGIDDARFAQVRGQNVVPHVPGAAHLCSVGIPRDGASPPRAITLEAGARSAAIPAPGRGWFDGTWHHVRVQLLPDGRCGLALDGRAVAILPRGNRPRGDVRVMLRGNSVGTRILVGQLRVYQGVPGDIDWTQAQVVR